MIAVFSQADWTGFAANRIELQLFTGQRLIIIFAKAVATVINPSIHLVHPLLSFLIVYV